MSKYSKDNVEEQRNVIIQKLEKILETSQEIHSEMQKIPHTNNMARRSLKPESGMYIIHHSSGGFRAEYHSEGQVYEISVNKRK